MSAKCVDFRVRLALMGVYAATKNAVTEVSPGMTSTDFAGSMTDIVAREAIEKRLAGIAMPAEAVARGIAYAIKQPDDVDVGSIVVRPTAQD